MATTQQPKASPADSIRRAKESLANARADARTVTEAAEELLWQIVDTTDDLGFGLHRRLSPEDLLILDAAGIRGDREIRIEASRVGEVVRLMDRAGSPQAHEAAQKQVAAARKAEADQRPALEKAIAEAQAKLDALAQKRTAAEEDLDRMDEARARLREPGRLPAFVRQQFETAAATATNHLHRAISEAQNRVEMIDAIEHLHATSRDAQWHAVAVRIDGGPELIARDDGGREFVVEHLWKEYQQQLAAERPKLLREIEQLEQQKAEAMEALGATLDFYVSKL